MTTIDLFIAMGLLVPSLAALCLWFWICELDDEIKDLQGERAELVGELEEANRFRRQDVRTLTALRRQLADAGLPHTVRPAPPAPISSAKPRTLRDMVRDEILRSDFVDTRVDA